MKIFAYMEEGAKSLEKALADARASKLDGVPFFAQLAEAYGRVHFAAALMRAYGKIDPEEHEAMRRKLFGEPT